MILRETKIEAYCRGYPGLEAWILEAFSFRYFSAEALPGGQGQLPAALRLLSYVLVLSVFCFSQRGIEDNSGMVLE